MRPITFVRRVTEALRSRGIGSYGFVSTARLTVGGKGIPADDTSTLDNRDCATRN